MVVVDGSWNIIISHHLAYRKYVPKWWRLNRNRIICPDVAVNGQFLPGKSDFFSIAWKILIIRKFAWKNRIFLKIAWKNRHFLKICLEKSIFFYPESRPPDFNSDWRRWRQSPRPKMFYLFKMQNFAIFSILQKNCNRSEKFPMTLFSLLHKSMYA